MFSNPVYNLPPQFNENALSQNFAGLGLNPNQQQKQPTDFLSFQLSQQQQVPYSIGDYVPPSLDDTSNKWSSPDEANVSYQRGSTAVRQYNNSTIDDYYKKFLRPITDYVAVPTNGQPTYVYQNLGDEKAATGTAPTQQAVSGGAVPHEPSPSVQANVSQTNTNESEEKKHKKKDKHKKRSSKHGHSEKVTDEHKSSTTDNVVYQQQQQQQQQQVAAAPPVAQTGGVGPQAPMRHESNPVVFFDIEIDNDARGRLVMELFRHVLPRTSQNFLSLCLNEQGYGYRFSYFHRIIPGFMAQGGDFEKSNGTGGYSIYGEKFDDEGFPFTHDRPGLLSMANSGPNTNGSQFFLTFVPCPHLDHKHVVFGQVLQGFHLLKDLELSGSDNGEVSREVKIANSGQLQ